MKTATKQALVRIAVTAGGVALGAVLIDRFKKWGIIKEKLS